MALDKVFALRLETETYDKILAITQQTRRSVNSEIIIAIEKYISEYQNQFNLNKKDDNHD